MLAYTMRTLLLSQQEAEHTTPIDTSATAVVSKANEEETKTSDTRTDSSVEAKTKETGADADVTVNDNAKAALGVKPDVPVATTDEGTSKTAAITASGADGDTKVG
jgi:hypothetical protein